MDDHGFREAKAAGGSAVGFEAGEGEGWPE